MVLYLDEVSKDPGDCFELSADRVGGLRVGNLQPVAAALYEYYSPEKRALVVAGLRRGEEEGGKETGGGVEKGEKEEKEEEEEGQRRTRAGAEGKAAEDSGAGRGAGPAATALAAGWLLVAAALLGRWA